MECYDPRASDLWKQEHGCPSVKQSHQMDLRARVQIIGGQCLGYNPGCKGTIVKNVNSEVNGQPMVEVIMDKDKRRNRFMPHYEVEYLQPWRHRCLWKNCEIPAVRSK
jgi:hypothetical protein